MSTQFYDRSLKEIIADPRCKQKPNHVFGNFLFQNELGILFGDTNSGKSILAMDICMSYVYNESFWGVSMSDGNDGAAAFYYDLELNEAQFGGRYVNANIPDDRLTRVAYSTLRYGEGGIDDVIKEMHSRMKVGRPELHVLDNAQCLIGKNTDPATARYLMQQLKRLKETNHNATILLVGHTTKRNMSKPIDQNNLAGSKVIANYADSLFAISQSSMDEKTLYIKQIKSRSVAKKDTVSVMEISESPYLHLNYVEEGDEMEHIINRSLSPKLVKVDDFIRERIQELHGLGHSLRNIAAELGVSKSHVGRVVNGQA